jgi:hypothetical protein
MMTKWDSIQADLAPVVPKYWTEDSEIELEDSEILSLDELLKEEEELTLEWEGAE